MERCIKLGLTGGTGQIAYSLIFALANGDAFGPEVKIDLRIYDIEGSLSVLEGIKMEIEDGAYPLLEKVTCSNNLYEVFDRVDVALLIGSLPRQGNMERKDLLFANKNIFSLQGRVLNEVADKDVKIFVVGNPCNTNCLIALHHTPELNPGNFHALMRLDQNRMQALLAKKACVPLKEVSRLVVWGNHSVTQVPDYTEALVKSIPAEQYIGDEEWFEQEFISTIQNRGGAVLRARGKSSSASAARAIVCNLNSLFNPKEDEIFSSAVFSDGNPYGISKNLIFGFPCKAIGNGRYKIVENFRWNEKIHRKIRVTEKELLEERSLAGL